MLINLGWRCICAVRLLSFRPFAKTRSSAYLIILFSLHFTFDGLERPRRASLISRGNCASRAGDNSAICTGKQKCEHHHLSLWLERHQSLNHLIHIYQFFSVTDTQLKFLWLFFFIYQNGQKSNLFLALVNRARFYRLACFLHPRMVMDHPTTIWGSVRSL